MAYVVGFIIMLIIKGPNEIFMNKWIVRWICYLWKKMDLSILYFEENALIKKRCPFYVPIFAQ